MREQLPAINTPWQLRISSNKLRISLGMQIEEVCILSRISYVNLDLPYSYVTCQPHQPCTSLVTR